MRIRNEKQICGNSKDSDDGPTQQYVLADIYARLEAHSRLAHSYVNTAATSHTGTDTTSNFSSSK
jgi:hypothetical protein